MSLEQIWADIRDEVEAGLRGSESDLRLAEGVPFKAPDPRSVVLGPPAFGWVGMCTPNEPDTATFTAWLIAKQDERAIERLLSWLPDLIAVLQAVGDDCTVTDCRPAAYPTGGPDLPAYMLTVELTL
jgi:hypothetical protein